jgi:hypothetical protein
MKRRRRAPLGALLSLGALAFFPGCATSPAAPVLNLPPPPASAAEDTFEARQERLAAYREHFASDLRRLYRAATEVNVADGVQEFEAWVLAQSYLAAWVDPSALIIELKQDPADWIAENMSAATEGPGPTIRVNRHNGSIRRQGSLQLVWPESFRDKL